MKIKVEQCNGGHQLYFRLTMPNGERERVNGERWTREVAKEALNIAEHVYGFDRSKVRFEHK